MSERGGSLSVGMLRGENRRKGERRREIPKGWMGLLYCLIFYHKNLKRIQKQTEQYNEPQCTHCHSWAVSFYTYIYSVLLPSSFYFEANLREAWKERNTPWEFLRCLMWYILPLAQTSVKCALVTNAYVSRFIFEDIKSVLFCIRV